MMEKLRCRAGASKGIREIIPWFRASAASRPGRAEMPMSLLDVYKRQPYREQILTTCLIWTETGYSHRKGKYMYPVSYTHLVLLMERDRGRAWAAKSQGNLEKWLSAYIGRDFGH